MFALILTGPPGAGKSVVLEGLSDALVDDDVAHATVETEALTSTHPALDDAQWFAHVRDSCRLHRQHGQRLLLVASTVESEADLRALVDAVGADEHAVVRLEADPETLARRIVEREPDGWSGLDQLLAASARRRPSSPNSTGSTSRSGPTVPCRPTLRYGSATRSLRGCGRGAERRQVV